AFIGMLFGELGGATHGLGFFTVVTRAEVRINEAIAVSLFTFGVFVMLSVSLRFVSKKLRYFMSVPREKVDRASFSLRLSRCEANSILRYNKHQLAGGP